MWVRYTICYLGSFIIIWAYCVGKVHNILYLNNIYDNGTILCR